MKLSITSVSCGHESKTVVQCGFPLHISLIENYKMWGLGDGCVTVWIQ
jgi:hypothetical protein